MCKGIALGSKKTKKEDIFKLLIPHFLKVIRETLRYLINIFSEPQPRKTSLKLELNEYFELTPKMSNQDVVNAKSEKRSIFKFWNFIKSRLSLQTPTTLAANAKLR